MRGTRLATVAVVVAVLGGCGAGADANAEADDPADADAPTTTSAPAVEGLPDRPLQGAAVAVVGDEVWVVGGVAGYAPYEANPTIIRRSADGTILGTVPLDLPEGMVLQAASPTVTVDGAAVLVGFRCRFNPHGENGACVTGEPALHRIDADGLVALDVPDGWGTGPDDTAGSFGYPPWVVGTVGDHVVTASAVGEGPIPGSTEEVEVAVYDPDSSTVATVPTVPGVVTGTSVCADGTRIWSLVPAIDANRQVTGADVWAQDDPIGAPDAPPRKVVTIALDGPRGITSGGLTCGEGFLVVTGSTDGGAFAVVDTDTGTVVGDVTGWEDWNATVRVPVGGDGTRMVISRAPASADVLPVTHRLVTRDGVTDLPDGGTTPDEPGIVAPLAVVEVEGRLLDVGAWLAEPDVEQPAIELA